MPVFTLLFKPPSRKACTERLMRQILCAPSYQNVGGDTQMGGGGVYSNEPACDIAI